MSRFKLSVWLGGCLYLGAAAAMARAEPAERDHSAAAPAARQPFSLRLHLYTRQVQLGTLAGVVHPGVGVAAEAPVWRAGWFAFFPVWQVGFEHHAGLHTRWYAGVQPSVRVELAPFAVQLSLGVNALRLWSRWKSYHFEDQTGQWSAGERESKWCWLFEADVTAWIALHPRVRVGIGYGFGVMYPFAPVNDVPALPLTRLGLYGLWSYGA